MKYSFVIPCYRSEKTIESVVADIQSEMDNLGESDYEIVLVNDCSPDNTWEIISALAEKNKSIKGINLAKNFGQHSALMAGYGACTGNLIVSLDDDGQTSVNELGKLLEKIPENDVVYAYYEKLRQSPFRIVGNYLARKMTIMMLNMRKDFKGSSFFVMKKFVAEEILRYENPYPYISGLIIRSVKRIACVPVSQRKRLVGKSGYTLHKLISLWLNGFTAFSVKPLRIATILGGGMSCMGFLYAIYLILRRLWNPDVPVGYSSMMCALIFLGGVLMLMLGLIGEYIGRIYICLNKSPQYVIRDTINIMEEVK